MPMPSPHQPRTDPPSPTPAEAFAQAFGPLDGRNGPRNQGPPPAAADWVRQKLDVETLGEERLQIVLEQRRLALEAARLGTWSYDLASGRNFLDPRCREIFGLDWSHNVEVDCRMVIEAIHPEDRQQVEAAVQKAFDPAGDGRYEAEFRVMHSGGRARWVNGCGQAYFTGDGNDRTVIQFSGTCMDITELRVAHAEVAAWRGRYEAAARASRLILYDWQLDCDKIVYEGDVERMLGYPRAELDGGIDVWVRLVHPDDRAEFLQIADRVWRSENAVELQYRMLRKDGSIAICEGWGQVVRNGPDGKAHVVGFVSDVTARVEAERALRGLNETLEKRVAERTAVLAHRSRQLTLLANQLTAAEHSERKKLALMLHDGLQQMLVAVKLRFTVCRNHPDAASTQDWDDLDQLLDEAIQTSRSLAIELSPPILHNSELPQALEWLARWFGAKHRLQVQIVSGDEFPELEENVKVFLFHATRELLFNTVKHGGVQTARVLLIAPTMDIVQVVVEDQGRGFDATVLEELSDPPGFGLLSIRERAEALGGTLVIESAPGAGARFRLILPALKESQAADFAAAAELSSETADAAVEPPSPKIRLLIVDDHKSVRQGLMAMLDMQPGLEVVGEAADGLAALEQVAALQPQIVVMDVNMPRMNGIDATREISARYPHVVVIGLSLHRDEEITRQMRAAGAAASLNKDGPSELLVATIHAVHSARGEPKPAVRG